MASMSRLSCWRLRGQKRRSTSATRSSSTSCDSPDRRGAALCPYAGWLTPSHIIPQVSSRWGEFNDDEHAELAKLAFTMVTQGAHLVPPVACTRPHFAAGGSGTQASPR
jgi:hypothetical protein